MRPCWLARIGAATDPCDYSPRNHADPMHVGLSRNWLEKAPLGPHLSAEDAMDPRLIRDGCRKHHHALDNGHLTLSRAQLPESVERYAEAHGLTWKLDKDFS